MTYQNPQSKGLSSLYSALLIRCSGRHGKGNATAPRQTTGGVLALVVLFAAVLAGCDLYYDVDSVELVNDDNAGELDVDVGDPEDAAGDTEDVPDTGPDEDPDVCVETDDDVLCDAANFECGEHALSDDCGTRSVDCGDCSANQECSENYLCVCEPESEEELCDAHSPDACGQLTIEDRCGNDQPVDCGGCEEDFGCNTEVGVCQACEVDCDGKCGMVPDGCGEFVDCDADPDGAPCTGGESCVEFECEEGTCPDLKEECDAEECGDHSDGCGGIISCGDDCPDGWDCEIDACICQPETEEELCDIAESEEDVQCGTTTVEDHCGNERVIDCGGCAEDEGCDANQCVPESCVGADLDTDVEHCGECENQCTTAEICDQGSCEPFECVEDQGTNEGCDPFDEESCEGDDYCNTLRLIRSGGVPSHFQPACTDELGEPGRDESCEPQEDCQEGLFCVGWDPPDPRSRICSQICDRETQHGCDDDEFCVDPFFDAGEGEANIRGVGFCTPRCSPTDPGACPSGQRCTADPAFPESACTPNFRCLFNGGSGGKSEGDFCTRAELDSDGCPSGLSCAPVNGDDVCVERCDDDADCSDGDCVNADSPWQQLRYCSLD